MTPVRQPPLKKRSGSEQPRVLVVDDELDVIDFMRDAIGRNIDCRMESAANMADACRIIETEGVDLLIADLNLPDGDGSELIATLRKRHPLASAMVVTGAPTVATAVSALRHGAVDFLSKPFKCDEFLGCVRTALDQTALRAKSESRIDRLRTAVRRLNDARRLVTRKVDLLCNDLVAAYGDLSRQLDLVRTTESFRGVVVASDDLEQMLCHAMDWILRQIGYSNVAIWLAGPEPDFQLGAYMKYTIAGDPALTEAMRQGVLNILRRDGMLHLSAGEAAQILTADELRHLRDQAMLGIHCTYLGESLAGIVLFREGNKPFSAEDASILRAVAPVFAVTLATMVRSEVVDEDEQSDDGEDEGFGAPPLDEGPDDSSSRRRKKDDADWWKRGEQPPF